MQTKTIKILLVEDNPIDADMLSEELQEMKTVKFEISHVTRLNQAFDSLRQQRFDLVLLDLGLPDSQGLATFLKVYKHSREIPIVVLSGLDDEELGMEAVSNGAQDYLVKGKHDRHLLTRSMTYAIQRQQLLAELQLSKERASAQYKWIPIPTYTWEKRNDDFILIDQNHAALQNTQLQIPSGAKARDFFKDCPDVVENLLKCFASKSTASRERNMGVNSDTTGRHLSITYVYVPPLFVMVHIQDLTEQKNAESALKQSEERFRAIFESAQDCIFIKDRSLRYTHVNPAMERLFEIPCSRFIGMTDEDLFGPEASTFIKEVDIRVLKGEFIEEEHTRKVSGMPVTFNEIRVPMKDGENRIVGLCGIARNMTERKKIEFSPPVTEEYPSEAMRSTLARVRISAERDSTILLLGESGSGKDYLAKLIHEKSKRANGPFFAINCAAVAPELAESELFGHERGAFTGAHGRKRGLLELAEGGTLLLNEIGELTLSLQAKLLTFLDSREFTRVGGEKSISVNARLITATNRNLEAEVEAGRFRKDLFYRLNVISITVPPLRERREDIPILVRQIISRLRTEIQLPGMPDVDAGTMNALMNYHWPGNVRELRNVLERALMLSDGRGIHLTTLGIGQNVRDWSLTISFPTERTLNDVTREMKSSLVNEALRRSGGSRQGAARLLGISRYSLKHYMNSLDLEIDWDNGSSHFGDLKDN